MDKSFTILIADRNRHVRELLKREMLAEGYRPQLVKTGGEILKWVNENKPLDLLILDLDLPDVSELAILKKLQDLKPALPVVVHTYLTDYVNQSNMLNTATLVEKDGNSVDRLKKIVSTILLRNQSERRISKERTMDEWSDISEYD